MSESDREIVRVESIAKTFRGDLGLRPKQVLQGISFQVERGEIFGFVGPNGAGKTTTLKILMGLIRPTSGSATILGHDVRSTDFRQHVGFLPENPWFHDFLTGREFLRFYARISGLPREGREERIRLLLGRVGLEYAADQRLRTFSKGMLQRIGIAQALIHDPSMIFLDEPMSGLDPLGRKEIRDLILQLHGEGKTVFMNTHILSDVEMLCDRVAILVKGQIRYQGRIEDFLHDKGRQSDIVVSGIAPELAERFEEDFHAEVRGRGDRIEFRVPDKHVADVLRSALDVEAQVLSVTPHRASLEEIFLSAVEAGKNEESSS